MKKTLIVIFLVLTLFLASCGNDLPSVYVQSVSDIMGYGAAGAFNVSAGIVTAQDELRIDKDEGRKVAELNVEVGQTVHEGDVLFAYDMDEAKLALDRAELELEQLKNSVTDYAEQIADLERERQYVHESEQLAYTVRIQTLQTDKKEAEYNVSVKELELESMRNSLGDGRVLAPITGKVKSINQNGGYDDYTGQPLPYITLVADGAYRIKGRVNELTMGCFVVGQPVIVTSRIDPNMTWHGVIDLVETTPEESQGDPFYYGGQMDGFSSFSEYPFYVTLDSTDGLILGQHVFISPDDGQKAGDSLWLDASYIVGSEEEGYFVWAADGDEIEKREITVGAYDEMRNSYEIQTGLSKEDLIAFPEEGVAEGAPITRTAPEEKWDTDAPNQNGMPIEEGIG